MWYEVHRDLLGETDQKFSSEWDANSVDVLFLCMGHGESRKFLEQNKVHLHTKIVDLSHDFRVKPDHVIADRTFIYGLTEVYKEEVKTAQNIANPGCFATGIQLALLPLVQLTRVDEAHINAITGSTGAGQSLKTTTHFTWRNNNISIYKPFTHQHLAEIRQSAEHVKSDFAGDINFIPVRGNFTRGIFASLYAKCDLTLDAVREHYDSFYADSPFVFQSERPVDLKQVVNTNKCFLHIEKYDDKILITSVVDNLLKGASGQAVQNMNLMFDLDETAGLQLKANYF